MNIILKLPEEVLLKTTETQRKVFEAMEKRNEEKVDFLRKNSEKKLNALAGRSIKMHTLMDFKLESLGKFIYEYETADEPTRESINLKGKLGINIYRRLGRDLVTAEKLIEQSVRFNKDVSEEYTIEYLFQDVEEVLSYLPAEAERKRKLNAKAIFKKLPKYIWVYEEDLVLNPALQNEDRKELMKYILSCIAPSYVRGDFKKMIELEKMKITSGKNEMPKKKHFKLGL
eukprot:snap_masked-scaffold_28-processed-gene-4.7-mRNA-1 protein AED:1.00 eAED:1.00 QI:0/0/0/0/1/1/2/0/228